MRINTPARWAIWFASLAILCGFAWTRLDVQQPINTDILSLLPNQTESPALKAAIDRNRREFVQQMLILISGPDNGQTREAAQAARNALKSAGLQSGDAGETVGSALAVYQAHHFALLDPHQIARLKKQGAKALATDVAVALASPAGLVNVFGSDPGGYLADFMSNLPRPYPGFLPDGPFLSARRDGNRYFLLRMELSGPGFAKQGSALAALAVKNAGAAVERECSECKFAATGAPLFADVARREAKQETMWLTIVSTLLIMVLIAWVFRSLAPHVLGFLQLGASVAAASAAVIVCFGSIQILTLVFGTTLLGIAIDYAFLYFSEYWFGDSAPPDVMRKIRPGLYMGMLTGMAAFAFLALAGFPGLTQIAVFSVAGLFEAGLVVVLIFPVTLTKPPAVAAHPAVHRPQRFIHGACRPSRWRYILPALALLVSIGGWVQLKTNDSVSELSHFPPRLVQTDQQIRSTLARIPPSGFYLTTGPDLATALQREQSLFEHIRTQVPDARPLGLSRFLPSLSRQHESLAAWRAIFDSPDALRAAFGQIGLPPEFAARLEAGWRKANRAPLTADELFEATPDLKRFVIRPGQGVALRSTVFSDRELDPAALKQAAAATRGASYIVPLDRIANTFERIRVRATWLVVIGYLLISALLVWRYGRREALRMLYPPLLAMGFTLGVFGWIGEPLNVFVVVALILILGLGRDYAVFLREGGARDRSPALAVSMSALTTLCSFGLLSLSQIPALHAFGLATLIGILASYFCAPLSLRPERRKE